MMMMVRRRNFVLLRDEHRRSRLLAIECFSTDSEFRRLKDLPIDNTHAKQRDIECSDGGDNRVHDISNEMAVIRWTTVFVAKDGKEMWAGDEKGCRPNDTNENQHTHRCSFGSIIHWRERRMKNKSKIRRNYLQFVIAQYRSSAMATRWRMDAVQHNKSIITQISQIIVLSIHERVTSFRTAMGMT